MRSSSVRTFRPGSEVAPLHVMSVDEKQSRENQVSGAIGVQIHECLKVVQFVLFAFIYIKTNHSWPAVNID